MAVPKRKALSLAEQIKALEDPTPVDFDPETLDPFEGRNGILGSDSGESEDENAGREHYVQVGKGRVRKSVDEGLASLYEGSRVSRKALNESEEEDSESDDDEDMDGRSDSDGSEGQINGHSVSNGHDEEEASATDATSEEDLSDSDSDGSEDLPVQREDGEKRARLRKMMSEEQQQIVASLSLATETDARKGKAVIAQRATFDRLLNTRIRLQKGLVAVNSMTEAPTESTAKAEAEKAAFELWSQLSDMRSVLSNTATGEKRDFDEMSSQDMWTDMQQLEQKAQRTREAVLLKWSSKVRSTNQLSTNGSLAKAQPQESIVSYLKSQLADSDRLVKKTQMPRACAPVQASKRVAIDPEIFDDADFYQLLLKELVDQRMADSQLSNGAKASWKAAREAKSKRVVDTKASKGRKLRYTVHEKLQNFMAPVNVNSWPERQADELFSSLLGRRVELAEESSDEEVIDHGMLFRA